MADYNGLSDLGLVAQAMAPTKLPSSPQQPSQHPNAQAEPSAKDAVPKSVEDLDHETQSALESLDIDISTLSTEELAAVQPILNALKISSLNSDGGGVEDGDEEDRDVEGDGLKFEEILKELNAADSVADDLEDKLDALLASLGVAEKEIVEQVGEGKKQEAKETNEV